MAVLRFLLEVSKKLASPRAQRTQTEIEQQANEEDAKASERKGRTSTVSSPKEQAAGNHKEGLIPRR